MVAGKFRKLKKLKDPLLSCFEHTRSTSVIPRKGGKKLPYSATVFHMHKNLIAYRAKSDDFSHLILAVLIRIKRKPRCLLCGDPDSRIRQGMKCVPLFSFLSMERMMQLKNIVELKRSVP